ncbi:MAG: hypothetical protein V4616_04430 [Bacteroidota bacterium]
MKLIAQLALNYRIFERLALVSILAWLVLSKTLPLIAIAVQIAVGLLVISYYSKVVVPLNPEKFNPRESFIFKLMYASSAIITIAVLFSLMHWPSVIALALAGSASVITAILLGFRHIRANSPLITRAVMFRGFVFFFIALLIISRELLISNKMQIAL